jgi:hypothetical protein
MSDRLQDLLRQRALIQEQLAWLDREIASASAADATTTPAPAPAPQPARAPLPQPGYLASQAAAIAAHQAAARAPATDRGENPAVAAAADAILEKYRVQPDSLKTDVRQGCFLYFFGALAAVAVIVVGLYYVLSGRGP